MARKHIIDSVEDLITLNKEIKEQNVSILAGITQLLSVTEDVKRISDEQLTELKRGNAP